MTKPTKMGTRGSLWTTPASELAKLARRPFVDKSVTAAQIRAAVERAAERMKAFAANVSPEVLEQPVDGGPGFRPRGRGF